MTWSEWLEEIDEGWVGGGLFVLTQRGVGTEAHILRQYHYKEYE